MKIDRINQIRGFSLTELVVVIGAVVILLGIIISKGHRHINSSKGIASVANARQIKTALDYFAIDFDGDFVNVENGESVSKNGITSTTQAFGFFNALIDSGTLDRSSEDIFYMKELKEEVPDHTEGDGEGTLEDHETGFSYVVGLKNTSEGKTPIVLTKLRDSSGTFYENLWDGKALIVRVNGSAAAEVLTRSNSLYEKEIYGAENSNVFELIKDENGTFLEGVFIAR